MSKPRYRCTCGYPGRNHSRNYCNPFCKACNYMWVSDVFDKDTAEPTASDIARAHELIREHGWTHLLATEKP